MKILLVLISIVLSSIPQEKLCQLDVTDLVINAMNIGEEEFKMDFNGQSYQKKNWKVYNSFIDKDTYHNILSISNPGFALAKDSCEITLVPSEKISLTQTTLKHARNDFNQVEIQRPYYNFEKSAFSTIIWVRDKALMGGFCVLVYFNIEKGKCKFISGWSFSVSEDPI